MAKPSQLDRAIESIKGEIAVLEAALARLQRQKDEQHAAKQQTFLRKVAQS